MARHNENAPDMAINRIVEGTIIEGDIRSESNVRIDGQFVGNINTRGRLVIGPTGKVEGSVNCENSEIEGFLKGKINIQQQLSLKASAKVEGDIVTAKLSIEPGATFTGACSMGAKVKDMTSLDLSEPKEKQVEEKSA